MIERRNKHWEQHEPYIRYIGELWNDRAEKQTHEATWTLNTVYRKAME